MWNLNVPKRIFFYWGASRLSFLRYMTVYSFKKYNPDWEIKFYVPLKMNPTSPWPQKQFENNCSTIPDYTNHITNRLGIIPTIFDFRKIGLDNSMNEVHKSDFLRYHLLHTQGGVWADMDVLFTKPMDSLLCNQNNINKNAYIYFGENPNYIQGHAIGFLMGTQGNLYFKDVLNLAKMKFNGAYQGAGPDMLNDNLPIELLRERYPDIHLLDKESVYSIDHTDHIYLYDECNYNLLSNNSIGIHWYGGSILVKPIIETLNHNNLMSYNNHGTVIQFIKDNFGSERLI